MKPTTNQTPSPVRYRVRQWWLVWAAVVLVGVVAPAAQANETVTYFHNDALGSPVAATDAQGNVLWREAYKPYGERIRKEDGGTNTQWYTGKPEEAYTGLSYFGARWYDPVVGRFQGIDPVDFQEGNIQSFNRYAYVANNPYRYFDPDGEESQEAVWKLLGIPNPNARLKQAAKTVADVGNTISQVGDSIATDPTTYIPIGWIGGTLKFSRLAEWLRDAKGAKSDLAALDSTGKVHGLLPRPKDLNKFSKEELSQLRDELKQSVQQRIKKNIELGSDKPHGQRQAAEQQLIKSIDKFLDD